jgi:hypothetical protein
MPTEQREKLEKVRGEHIKQLFGLYQAKAQNFRKTFAALSGFALLFFFLILIPAVSIKVQKEWIGGRLEALSSQITQAEIRIAGYRRAQSGIEKLQTQIEDGPEDLREFIREIENADPEDAETLLPSGSRSQEPGDKQWQSEPCSPVDARPGEALREEWLDCMVGKWVQIQFAGYQEILDDEILGSLQELEDGSTLLIDIPTLERGLEELQGSLKDRLAWDEGFWETFSGKELFYRDIEADVVSFWETDGAMVIEQKERLESDLADQRDEQADLIEQQAQRLKQEEGIAARIEQIEFPFGKLPIGLEESVAVFPLLLAIGFLIVVSPLLEAMRLRRAFHTLHQQQDPGKEVLTDEQIALIAPLWIDPADPEQDRRVQLVALLAPALIFVLACGLIFYSWTLPAPYAASTASRWLYGVLYLLSAGLFVCGYRSIQTELGRHADRETEMIDT